MKKIVSVLLSLLCVLFLLPVSVAAEELPIESYLTYEVVGDTVTITGCVESYSGKLEIPAEIDGKPVTAIAGTAFFECVQLSAVVIPEGVTSIGDNAFGSCLHLSEVTIPSTVVSIGNDAFKNTALYNDPANWSEGMVYNGVADEQERGKALLYIGDCLVAANPALSRAVVQDGTRLIADYAFFGGKMKDVSIPASVAVVGKNAFLQCDALTDLHFGGTEDAFGKIALGEGNEKLTSVTKHYESQLENLFPEEEQKTDNGKKPVNLWKVISIASGIVAAVTFVLGVIAYWPKKKKDEAEDKPEEEEKPEEESEQTDEE